MAEEHGLETWLGRMDPEASDNSMVTVALDPDPTQETPPASDGSADVSALIARLEQLERARTRDLQQLRGSADEVQYTRKQLEQRDQAMREMLEQNRQLATQIAELARTQQPQAAPARMTLRETIEKVALGEQLTDDQIRAALLPQAAPLPTPSTTTTTTPATQPVTAEQVEAMLNARAQTQRVQQTLLDDLATRHRDVLTQDHMQAIIDRYATLASDPMIQTIFPDQATGVNRIEVNGRVWDYRLLDRAASEVRLEGTANSQRRQQTRETVNGLPAGPGGAQTTRPPASREDVVLPEGVFQLLKNNPNIAAAFTALTGNKDPRSHAKTIWEKAPEDVRAAWRREAALRRPER